MSDYIRLDEVLTDEEILEVRNRLDREGRIWTYPDLVRACIRLALEKVEKVEGFVTTTRASGLVHDGHAAGWFFVKPDDPAGNGTFRHATLLLGPKYEPKPVRSAEERIREALAEHGKICSSTHQHSPYMGCQMARILRGEGE